MGLIKLPNEICNWIDKNVQLIMDLVIETVVPTKIDSISFINPYTNLFHTIDIFIIFRFPYVAAYIKNENAIIINSNIKLDKDVLIAVLYHEFTHVIDPKQNINEIKDNFLSNKEIDAYFQSIIYTFKNLLYKSDYILYKVQNYIFKSESFPYICGYENYFKVINNLNLKHTKRFKRILFDNFKELLNKNIDIESLFIK